MPRASARLNLRVPPGLDPLVAQDALVAHLEAHVPWGAHLRIEREALGEPFRAATDGPGYADGAGRHDDGHLRDRRCSASGHGAASGHSGLPGRNAPDEPGDAVHRHDA